METIILDKDIKVFYVTASTFPEGILAAHQTLHAKIPYSTERKYFGISRPENNGKIVYRAAAEEMKEGEGAALNCDTLVLKKGKYISLTVLDYMKDLSSIEKAFQQLLASPDLDPEGYCVEWYLTDKDLRCMVRLNQ
jgi:hypothetical protein